VPLPALLIAWSWMKRAWLWLKKYWMWVLLPVGVAVFLVGRLTGGKPADVVAPELLGAADKKLVEDEKAERAKEEAKTKLVERVAEVKREHSKTVEKLSDTQKELVEDLTEDPEALNAFLKSVGEEVRGG